MLQMVYMYDIIYKLSAIRISQMSWMGFCITSMQVLWTISMCGPRDMGPNSSLSIFIKFVHNSLEQCPLVDARCGV